MPASDSQPFASSTLRSSTTMKSQLYRTESSALSSMLSRQGRRSIAWVVPALALGASVAIAQTPARTARAPAKAGPAPADTVKMLESSSAAGLQPASREGASDTAALQLIAGKSTVVRLPEPVDRISVGNPGVADITLLRSNELYLLGKSFGTTNVILWRNKGRTTVYEVQVSVDVGPLRKHLRELWPSETEVKVGSAANSIVLSGGVRSAPVAEQMVRLAQAYAAQLNSSVQAGAPNNETQPGPAPQAGAGQAEGAAPAQRTSSSSASASISPRSAGGSAQVVNLLQVLNPQQVMLEVKVAEINRTYLESLGINLTANSSSGSMTYSLVSNFFSNPGALGSGTLAVRNGAGDNGALKAQASDGLVKILAEPNILALSGQEGSFLAGGRLLVPVAQQGQGGTAGALSLEEKEYGVGLKFTPVVLENGRILLRVAPEVSELVQRSVSDSSVVLPQFTTRRASSTVQLMDGQSLAIAGLIKNNVTEQLTRIPVLGELPILGALFRSADFVNERTELVFVVTPRLVKPLPADYKLPTDNFEPPSRYRFMIEGKLEGVRQRPAQN